METLLAIRGVDGGGGPNTIPTPLGIGKILQRLHMVHLGGCQRTAGLAKAAPAAKSESTGAGRPCRDDDADGAWRREEASCRGALAIAARGEGSVRCTHTSWLPRSHHSAAAPSIGGQTQQGLQ